MAGEKAQGISLDEGARAATTPSAITHRRSRAQARPEANEARATARYARSLIEASLDPLVTISADGKITDVNEATVKVTGVARDKLIGTDFSNYFTEPEKARAGYREVFAQGSVTDYPLTVRARDGHRTEVLYNASVYRDADGNVLGVFAAARDVTAQRRASEYARSLIEASLDPLVTISPDGKIADVNEATVDVTGVPRDKLIGSDFASYFTDPESARTGYREAFETGSVRDYALALRHRTGAVMDVLYNASVYRDETGAVAGVFAAARDMTGRKRAEEAKARAIRALRMLNACNNIMIHAADEQKLLEDTCRVIIESGGYRLAWVGYAEQDEAKTVRPMAWAGANGDYVGSAEISWSETDARGRGPTGSAIRTAKMVIARDTETDPTFAPWRERASAKGYRSSATMPLRANGKVYGALMVYAGESDAFDAEETKLLGELADDLAFATVALHTKAAHEEAEREVRRLNAELEQRVVQRTAQLEAANKELEAFSYSVSHDLRTPLRAIDGFSRILIEDYADKLDDEGKRVINVVRDSTVKMSRLIDDILAFSRIGRTDINAVTVDMEALVKTTLTDPLAPALAGRTLAIDIGKLPPAKGDRAMLERVWTNLLDNAVKFTAPKADARIKIGAAAGRGETVYHVRDNGVGFDMRYADKLFGVFQRLHGAEYPGTGIGLAIVKRIIARHGGRVWAEGKPGEGATFYFALRTEERPGA